MQWVGRVASAMAVAALSFTTGCAGFFVYPGSLNGGGGSTSSGDYVYVANQSTDSLAGFSVSSGTLTAVSGSPFNLGFSPTSVVVNPANTIVFVSGVSGLYGIINSYSIGTGGTLSLLASNTLGSADEVSMVVSPDGQWLVGLDANGPALNEAIVDVYEINATTGQLTALTASEAVQVSLSSGQTIVPLGIAFGPSAGTNTWYLFAALGTAGDLEFTFTSSTSSNTPTYSFGNSIAQLRTGSATVSDNALAVSPNGSYLFIAQSGTSSGVAVYTIGSGGALTSVTGSPFAAGNDPFSVVVNSAGTDVYVANQVDGSISGFSVGSGGVLTAIGGSPFSSHLGTGTLPRALAIDNSKDYLLSANNGGDPDLAMFSFDQGTPGALVYSTSTATGTDPTAPVAIATTH
jgi:6-phosphogluconolactonase (cycloisomerase 2 family)